MQPTPKTWRVVSGITGLTFFFIANCTNFFEGLNILTGFLQIIVNVFVFLTWVKAYVHCRGFEKIVTLFGVTVPPIMAGITIWRVFLPVIFD